MVYMVLVANFRLAVVTQAALNLVLSLDVICRVVALSLQPSSPPTELISAEGISMFTSWRGPVPSRRFAA